MPLATTDEVIRLLRAGKTVSWVIDATGWPRRNVEGVARNAQLRVDRQTDTAVPLGNRTAPDPLEQVLGRGTETGPPASPTPPPPPTAPAQASPPPPAPEPAGADALLARARSCTDRQVVSARARAETALGSLADALTEHERAQREARARAARASAARAEVDRLEAALQSARDKLAEVACPPAPPGEPGQPGRRRITKVPDYDPAEVRAWARARGITRPLPGRFLPGDVVAAWRADQHQPAPAA